MHIHGTEVPDAGDTRLYWFSLGSPGEEMAVVYMLDALTAIGTEGGGAREEQLAGAGKGTEKLQEGDQKKAFAQ